MRKILISLMLLPILLMSLTLEESIVLAKQNNKKYLEAKYEANVAYAKYKGLKSSLLPQITLSGGYSLERTDYGSGLIPEVKSFTNSLIPNAGTINDTVITSILDGIMAKQIPSDPTEKAKLGASLKLEQVLYLGGKLTGGIKAAKLYDELQKLNVSLVEKEIIYQTKKNFYSTLLAKRSNEINQEALRISNKHYKQILEMYEQGLVSEYDKIRAELEVAKVRPNAVDAEKKYRLAKQNLSNYLGLDNNGYELEGVIVPNKDFKIADDSEKYYNDRVECKIIRQMEKMRKIGLKVEKGNYLPNIMLTGEYKLGNSGDEYKIKSDEFVGIASVGIGFSIPIFKGGGNYYKVKEARAEFEKATITRIDTEDKLKLDIKNAILTYEYAFEKDKEQSLNIELAEKGLKIAESRFENQVGIQLELLDAQLQSKVSKLQKLYSDFQLLMAQEYYKKSIGKD